MKVNNQHQELMSVLNSIEQKLSILIALQKLSIKRPEVSGEEKIILNLCNMKNSVEDIIKTTNKTRTNVEVTLSHLKKKGLIKSTKINNKVVYGKI